jgi:hypothetical protein
VETNIYKIKLFVLVAHFNELSKHVISLTTNITHEDVDVTDISFNKTMMIKRKGDEVILVGYYTTQKLCDAAYLSYDSGDFKWSMTKNEKKEYNVILDRACAEYPEILI